MQPSIGRIVHFVTDGGVRLPAIITRVHSEVFVNLKIFTDDAEPGRWETTVMYEHDCDKVPVRTWHWPERVE